MPIHPQCAQAADVIALRHLPPLDTVGPVEARSIADTIAELGLEREAEPVEKVWDVAVPGAHAAIPIRLYRPAGAHPGGVLLYFHGGGWVTGTISHVDRRCRVLANAGRCLVIAVEYRLAPEHPFPAALEDCYDVAEWIAAQDTEPTTGSRRIAVGGESAGANLAAAVTLLARDRGGPPIALQVLLVPVLKYRNPDLSRQPALEGLGLSPRLVDWYWRQYLGHPLHGWNPLASPLDARSVTGLPAAFVLTAQFDAVRNEGEDYARRLSRAGVPVSLRRGIGMVHSFLAYSAVVDAAADALEDVGAALRAAFTDEAATSEASATEDTSPVPADA